MITRSTKRLSLRALVVDDELGLATAEGRAARALVQELQGRSIEVIEATTCEDGTSAFVSDSAIHDSKRQDNTVHHEVGEGNVR